MRRKPSLPPPKEQLWLLRLGNQEPIEVGQQRREVVQALADLLLDVAKAETVDDASAEGDDER
jgi:hypothetical protein